VNVPGRSGSALGRLNVLDAMSLSGPPGTPGSGIGLRVQRKAKVLALPTNQTCGVRETKPGKLHISEYEMLPSAKAYTCSCLPNY